MSEENRALSFGEQLRNAETSEAAKAKSHSEPAMAKGSAPSESQASRTHGPNDEIRRLISEMDRHFEKLGTLLSAPRSPAEAEDTH